MARRPLYTDLLGKLTRFLSIKETAPKCATQDRPLVSEITSLAQSLPMVADPIQEYQSRLTATVSEQGSAITSRIQLVNLTKISEHFGPRWPRVEKKVHSIIKSILSDRLAPTDFYVRQGDDNYYFLFSGLSETEAGIKCALLTSEITAKLIGDEAGQAELAELDFRSVVVRIDGLAPLAPPSLDAISQLLSYRQAEEFQSDPSPVGLKNTLKGQLKSLLPLLEAAERDFKQWRLMPPAAEERSQVIVRLEGMVHLLQQVENAFTDFDPPPPLSEQNNAPGSAPPPMAMAPLIKGDREKTNSPAPATLEWQLFHVLPRLIEQTLVKVETELRHQTELLCMDPPVEATTAPPVESGLEAQPPFDWSTAEVIFSFLPMWHVSKKVINSYRCQLALKGGGEIHPVETLLNQELDEVVIASLDRLVLREAINCIHAQLKSHQPNNIIVPVHFATLISSQTRKEYLGTFSLIRPEFRPYLIWELTYPHIGMSNQPIMQAASLLRLYGRAIMLHVSLDYRNFDNLTAAGIYAVGANIANHTESEAEVIRKIEIFKVRAERNGIKVYLHGVSSLSLATAAVCAGFDHIDGDIIAQPIDNPDGIQNYCIKNPYALMINATGN